MKVQCISEARVRRAILRTAAFQAHCQHPPSSLLYYTEVLLMDPARPRLAFRIGITGKRALSAPDAETVRARIAAALQDVQQTLIAPLAAAPTDYAPAPPLLSAISSLAAGTDRIFAEEALKLGCELQAVLPFHRAEYEKDASPKTRPAFRDLLPKVV